MSQPEVKLVAPEQPEINPTVEEELIIENTIQQNQQSDHLLDESKTLIDLGAELPLILEQLKNDVDSKVHLNPFYLQVQEDGILTDSQEVIYEIATEQLTELDTHQGKMARIGSCVIRPEFAENSHNLILTLEAQNVSFSPNFSNNGITVSFKVFDMEQYKEQINFYSIASSIKKSLLKRQIQKTDVQVWKMFTNEYKEEQESKRSQIERQQQAQHESHSKKQIKIPRQTNSKKLKGENNTIMEEEKKINNNQSLATDKKEAIIEEEGSNVSNAKRSIHQLTRKEDQDAPSPRKKIMRERDNTLLETKETSISVKKQSVERVRELREREEKQLHEIASARSERDEEQRKKIAKLQQFVLKREFLVYVGSGDFQKKPEVRNSILPRDPEDSTLMKRYSLATVKHLESQYK